MIKIERYDELLRFIQKFKEGFFDLLIIQSRGGLGKTYNTEKILDGGVLKINSHMTPLGLYEEAYRNRNKNIWMDDVEALFSNEKTIGICKQLCETHPEKEICYLTSWNMKKSRKVPKRFQTRSKVLMTVNSIQRLKNAGIQALLDRGMLLAFDPTPDEINQYIKTSFGKADGQILDFLESTMNYGLRDYIKCSQLKSAGFDNWKQLYTGNCKTRRIDAEDAKPKSVEKSRRGRPNKEYPQEVERIILDSYDEGLSSRLIRDRVYEKTKHLLCFNTIRNFIKRKRMEYRSVRERSLQQLAKEPRLCNVCGKVEVTGDKWVCPTCERDFPRVETRNQA